MCPRPTATLRMRERCSNSADLAGFRNQLVLHSALCSCLFLVQEMSQTQQESDRQKKLEGRRQQDRDKRARKTPDERNKGYEMAMTALPIQPLPVCVALLKSRLRHGCCTECCTVCWLAVVSAISLTLAPQCQAFH